jgi:small conductance mechanosensitive channel
MPAMDVVQEYVIQYGFKVLGAAVIMAVGAVLARWVGAFAQQWLDRQEMEPPVRLLLVRLVRGIVLAFALLAALDQLGVQIAPLIAGLGVAGLGIGFALQGVLSNVMAGLSIIFTKPYRVGEHISLLGVHGDVVKIDIFTTTLLHPDRSRVVIPNRKIVGEILHNFGTIRQLHLSVGVSYKTDLNRALTLARELVAQHPFALKEPAPIVGISSLGDSAIVLAVEPWVSVANYAVAQGALNHAIIERFRAEHIEIPFPQHEVRLVSGSISTA